MATESELLELLNTLEELLEQAGLGFVVSQERTLAVEGVATPAEEDVATSAEGDSEQVYAPSTFGFSASHKFRRSDAIRRPLSTSERLSTLLDLVEVAVVGTAEIEIVVRRELNEAMGESSPGEHTIRFSPPEEAILRGESNESWDIPDSSALAEKRVVAESVMQILQDLRVEAGVERPDWLIPETSEGSQESPAEP